MHYDGAKSYLFVNCTDIHKLKVKETEVNAIPLYAGKVPKDFSAGNMKKFDFMDLFMALMLIRMLLELMIY